MSQLIAGKDLRDGRREPLSQPVTRHGKTRPALSLSASSGGIGAAVTKRPASSACESAARRQMTECEICEALRPAFHSSGLSLEVI